MKTILRKYGAAILGALLGAVAGWCYWYFVGCASGTCAITSRPLNSTLYGALMGFLVAGLFKKEKQSEPKQ